MLSPKYLTFAFLKKKKTGPAIKIHFKEAV